MQYDLIYDKTGFNKAYCLFCVSGCEEKIAAEINKRYNDILALALFQEKHQSKNGVRSIVKKVMIPGYVFIFSNEDIPFNQILFNTKAIKFLMDTDGNNELYGENLEYANWVLSYMGMIGCSSAVRIGSRVKLIEGPLKDYEGHIKEISKKNKNGRIEVMFMGRLLSVWLPFEWVEETKASRSFYYIIN